jgi:membrane-bound lytic murein transglycosylase B
MFSQRELLVSLIVFMVRGYRYISFITFVTIVSVILPTSFVSAQALSSAEQAQLEAQLAQVQAEEAQAQSSLSAAQSQSSSLQSAINVIAAKIKLEQLSIQAENLEIKTLGGAINTQQSEIEYLSSQIGQNQQSVGNMFREIQFAQDTPPIVVLFQNKSISEFFTDSIALESLQQDINTLSAQLSVEQASSTAQKAALVTKQNATNDALYTIQQAQSTLKANESQQAKLLALSKSNEKSYTALLAQEKSQAAAINAKLFALAGGSNPIKFGQAYQYALAAQRATGIDPAFLLAILTQESNLGANQGNCYLVNESTGAGISVKTGATFSKVMSPANIPGFLQITSALQVDPLHTVVSCPQSIGWGGAMGPAQFIASTWLLFSNRVASALGFTGMANPWNPEHAFTASALYLSDLGADAGGYTAEYNAACRYYSGSPCSKSGLVASYGTSVMSLASTIQTTEINQLQAL